MLRYIMIRIVWMFITLFVILSMMFFLLDLAPNKPQAPFGDEAVTFYENEVSAGQYKSYQIDDITEITEILVAQAQNTPKCPKCYNSVVKNSDGSIDYMVVYEPLGTAEKYFNWLIGVVTEFDWGQSTGVQRGTPAFNVIRDRMPVTLQLNFAALFVIIPFSILFGTIAALKKGKWQDNLVIIGIMFFISVPLFVVATIGLDILGYKLDWLPTTFPSETGDGKIPLSKLIPAFVLPVFALSIGRIARVARTLRGELGEVLTSEFLLLARTKGLTRTQSVIRHAFRNALVPLVPAFIGVFVSLLSGSIVIENIFVIQGTGSVYVEALKVNNYNVILVNTAFYTGIALFSTLVIDLMYGVVDPRIRMGGRK